MSHIRCVVNGVYSWSPNEPQVAVSRPSAYGSRPVAVIGSMVPVMKHGVNLENRHRVKPPNPFTQHPENDYRRTQMAEASRRYRAKTR